MKTACLSVVALCLLLSTPVYADYIEGSISFDPGTKPFDVNGDGFNFGDLRGEFRINNVKTSSSSDGFFKDVNFPEYSLWGDFYIKQFGAMLGTTINISNVDFGSFSGTVVSDIITPSPASGVAAGFPERDLFFVGSWSPGTNALFDGFRDTVNTTIFLNIATYQGGKWQVFNSDIIMVTSAVPEPCSALIAGVLAGAHVYRRRRRLQKLQTETCA